VRGASCCWRPAAPHPAVAASRGARHRRTGTAPGDREPARGDGVTRTRQGVPARRARGVGCQRGPTARSRRSVSEALRRRLGGRVRRPSRGGTRLHRAGATASAVRTGTLGRPDTGHPVPAAPPRRPNPLRVSGVCVSMGQGPHGARSPQAADGPPATPERPAALPRGVQGAASSTPRRALHAAARHAPWVRQGLRSPRERGQPATVLQPGPAECAAVAQPASPPPP